MKYIIINTRQLWLWLLAALLGIIAYSSFTEDAVGIDHIIMGILFAALGLLFLFGCFITPICTVFSKTGVTVVYLTGRLRRARWQDVTDVSLTEDPGTRTRPPYTHSYEVYPMEGKDGLFSDGRIPKSVGVRFFFHRYWKKEIDGEWSIAKVKAWLREKFAEKEDPRRSGRSGRRKGEPMKNKVVNKYWIIICAAAAVFLACAVLTAILAKPFDTERLCETLIAGGIAVLFGVVLFRCPVYFVIGEDGIRWKYVTREITAKWSDVQSIQREWSAKGLHRYYKVGVEAQTDFFDRTVPYSRRMSSLLRKYYGDDTL